MQARFDWRRLKDHTTDKGDNPAWRRRLTDIVLEDEETRQDGRRVTQYNLLALCWVLGYTLIDEHVHHDALEFFPAKNPKQTLNEWITEVNREQKRVGSLILPRGVYKSTINISNCVQLIICWPLTIAIMVMCGRGDLADDMVGEVASFFYKPRNAAPTLFQALWPELCTSTKADTGKFTAGMRQTEPAIIEPAIWGESIEAGTSGYHPNVLITDDIHTNRNSRTYEQRIAIVKKYKLAKKVLLPIGSEYRIGTIYGLGDLFTNELLTMRPDAVRRVIRPAIKLKNGDRLGFDGFPEPEELELCFPTILSYEFLRAEYEADAETFFTQYLCDEYGSGEIVFAKEQMLAAMVDETALPLEGEIVIHWRLASVKKLWDTSCCAVGQIDRNRCYILEVMDGHYKPSMLAKFIVTLARKYNTHRINIEDSPGASLMIPAINNYSLTTGWKVQINWGRPIMEEDEEDEEDSGQRDLRIRNLEAVLSNNRLFFFSGMRAIKMLLAEFIQYGQGPVDALPDVVSRVADHLPQSLAADDLAHESLAYEAMKERDWYNLIYQRGAYAPPEPEPEEIEVEAVEDKLLTENGLEVWMPGLE